MSSAPYANHHWQTPSSRRRVDVDADADAELNSQSRWQRDSNMEAASSQVSQSPHAVSLQNIHTAQFTPRQGSQTTDSAPSTPLDPVFLLYHKDRPTRSGGSKTRGSRPRLSDRGNVRMCPDESPSASPLKQMSPTPSAASYSPLNLSATSHMLEILKGVGYPADATDGVIARQTPVDKENHVPAGNCKTPPSASIWRSAEKSVAKGTAKTSGGPFLNHADRSPNNRSERSRYEDHKTSKAGPMQPTTSSSSDDMFSPSSTATSSPLCGARVALSSHKDSAPRIRTSADKTKPVSPNKPVIASTLPSILGAASSLMVFETDDDDDDERDSLIFSEEKARIFMQGSPSDLQHAAPGVGSWSSPSQSLVSEVFRSDGHRSQPTIAPSASPSLSHSASPINKISRPINFQESDLQDHDIYIEDEPSTPQILQQPYGDVMHRYSGATIVPSTPSGSSPNQKRSGATIAQTQPPGHSQTESQPLPQSPQTPFMVPSTPSVSTPSSHPQSTTTPGVSSTGQSTHGFVPTQASTGTAAKGADDTGENMEITPAKPVGRVHLDQLNQVGPSSDFTHSPIHRLSLSLFQGNSPRHQSQNQGVTPGVPPSPSSSRSSTSSPSPSPASASASPASFMSLSNPSPSDLSYSYSNQPDPSLLGSFEASADQSVDSESYLVDVQLHDSHNIEDPSVLSDAHIQHIRDRFNCGILNMPHQEMETQTEDRQLESASDSSILPTHMVAPAPTTADPINWDFSNSYDGYDSEDTYGGLRMARAFDGHSPQYVIGNTGNNGNSMHENGNIAIASTVIGGGSSYGPQVTRTDDSQSASNPPPTVASFFNNRLSLGSASQMSGWLSFSKQEPNENNGDRNGNGIDGSGLSMAEHSAATSAMYTTTRKRNKCMSLFCRRAVILCLLFLILLIVLLVFFLGFSQDSPIGSSNVNASPPSTSREIIFTLLPTGSPTISPLPDIGGDNGGDNDGDTTPSMTPSMMPSALSGENSGPPNPNPNPISLPTGMPSMAPAGAVSKAPTTTPTVPTNGEQTSNPTQFLTQFPSQSPTKEPVVEATSSPSAKSSVGPTALPTTDPTAMSSVTPTEMPSSNPTSAPTAAPTIEHSIEPTAEPTIPEEVSDIPSSSPSWTSIAVDEGPWTGSIEGEFLWQQGDNTNGLRLEVLSAVQSMWKPFVTDSARDWSKAAAIDLTVKDAPHETACAPVTGAIKICNGNYGITQWRGLALLFLAGNEIIASSIRLNDYYATSEGWDLYNVCHQLGHALGLDHPVDDEEEEDWKKKGCMSLSVGEPIPNLLKPNNQNFDELRTLYGRAGKRHLKRRNREVAYGYGEQLIDTDLISQDIRVIKLQL